MIELLLKTLLIIAGTCFWAWWIIWDDDQHRKEAEDE